MMPGYLQRNFLGAFAPLFQVQEVREVLTGIAEVSLLPVNLIALDVGYPGLRGALRTPFAHSEESTR